MKKKFLFIATLLVLLLSVVGCESSTDADEDFTNPKEGFVCWSFELSRLLTAELPVYNQETYYWEATSYEGLEIRLTDGSFYCYSTDADEDFTNTKERFVCSSFDLSRLLTAELPVYNQETHYWEATSYKGLEIRLTDGSFYCEPLE